MNIDWRSWPPGALEAVYNPRAAMPDAEQALAERSAMSAAALQGLRGHWRIDEDLRYGEGPLQTFDLFRPLRQQGPARALAVFIHGGYWRALDKRDTALVVPPLLEAGAVVANLNYDLCPAVTLDRIVDEIVEGVRHCHAHAAQWGADPARLILMGHSAGAHLAASVLAREPDRLGLPADCLAGIVAISGIYEPEVVLGISVNELVRLDPATARRHDCLIREPRRVIPAVVSAGAAEPEGWIDQSRRYAGLLRLHGCPCIEAVIPAANHFTVLDTTFAAGSDTQRAIRALLAQTAAD
ncbi:MAG: alpha/beta hydrolase [Burkholderiaceae bacterium]